MATPPKAYGTGDPVVERLIDRLLQRLKPGSTGVQVRDLLTSSVKMSLESHDLADLKLANSALKELRYSFKIFSPYRETRKVIIFGSARSKPSSPEYKMARNFSRTMCKKGYMAVTGGGPGVMEAGNRGAPEGRDFALSIRLPSEQKPNPYISKSGGLINYKYFFTRKLSFVKETDATAIFPGGFGTLDECFEMLTLVQTGKSKPRPIVLMEPEGSCFWRDCRRFLNRQLLKKSYINPCDTHLYTIAGSVADAVKYIDTFYSVYHSLRYDSNVTILRLNRELSAATLRSINRKFKDILINGDIRPSPPTQKELKNNEFPHLPRLTLNFNRHDFGRLHELIHAINRD